jgi:tRNA(Arg) A34 adenosine deaminase TadA
MCLSAAFWARVSRIVYAGSREDAARAGFDDAFFYEQLARPPDWRKVPMIPFLRETAQEAFDVWLAKDDKTVY